jgi:hypothetical protein
VSFVCFIVEIVRMEKKKTEHQTHEIHEIEALDFCVLRGEIEAWEKIEYGFIGSDCSRIFEDLFGIFLAL